VEFKAKHAKQELKSQTEMFGRRAPAMTATNNEGLERICGGAADASSDQVGANWATHACGTCLPKQRMPWPLAIAVGRNAWFCFYRNVSVGICGIHSGKPKPIEPKPNKETTKNPTCQRQRNPSDHDGKLQLEKLI